MKRRNFFKLLAVVPFVPVRRIGKKPKITQKVVNGVPTGPIMVTGNITFNHDMKLYKKRLMEDVEERLTTNFWSNI